ncbi:hypothetical protein SAMN02745216_03994 [Desulfatibacillum alkenivorans DSM 16219]|uniref:Uncharacterized protein n=1 Tax=Desulfatibacillum alkenivorans DSM 16219 TaxID=1121393 RepID=A0A1M6UWU7_9BACT|nr:hypothetical protein [Desulfatibacillum alkenivorans]SHK73631.1 hypothetical protein SAMN02745216_03994 [Desulfatibacillum alkenivorans DSM 16219]
MRKLPLFFLVLFFLLASTNAYAYVGPGLGLGAIGTILGVLASILLALFAVLWYPIKRLVRKIKRKKEEQ